MPVITINLVPPDVEPGALKQLVLDLQETVSGISELELTKNDLTVLLPSDLLAWGVGSELIVFLDGLFVTPNRTPLVRGLLRTAIGETVWRFAEQHVPECGKVEVIQRPYDQGADGFWGRPCRPLRLGQKLGEGDGAILNVHRGPQAEDAGILSFRRTHGWILAKQEPSCPRKTSFNMIIEEAGKEFPNG